MRSVSWLIAAGWLLLWVLRDCAIGACGYVVLSIAGRDTKCV